MSKPVPPAPPRTETCWHGTKGPCSNCEAEAAPPAAGRLEDCKHERAGTICPDCGLSWRPRDAEIASLAERVREAEKPKICPSCGERPMVMCRYCADNSATMMKAESALAAEREKNAALREALDLRSDLCDARVLTDISEAIRCAVVVVLERWKAAAGREKENP